MSIEYPDFPLKHKPPTDAGINLDLLWFQLCMELADIKFMGRTHGNRRTYDAGCAGPMCIKAAREYSRRRTQATPTGKYRWIDPILDVWYPVARERFQEAQSKILGQMLQAEPEKVEEKAS